MNSTRILLVILMLQPVFGASAEEHGRIKKKPPTAVEAEHIASEMVRNDGSLQKGDIVATDRGFFLFRGLAPDGINNEFEPVPNSPVIRQKVRDWLLIATFAGRMNLIESNYSIGRASSALSPKKLPVVKI
jgi:hypothetical protein